MDNKEVEIQMLHFISGTQCTLNTKILIEWRRYKSQTNIVTLHFATWNPLIFFMF